MSFDESVWRPHWDTPEGPTFGDWMEYKEAVSFGHKMMSEGFVVRLEREPAIPKITVTLDEYNDLKQKEREYSLFLRANELIPNPLHFIKCAEVGCKAMQVNDGGRGLEVNSGCNQIEQCDFECSSKEETVSYCDEHIIQVVFEGTTCVCCQSCWDTGKPTKVGWTVTK